MQTVHAFCQQPSDRPGCKGQAVSNVLWAAAALDLRLAATMPDKMFAYLVHLVQHPSTKATVTAQNISTALWAAATLNLRLTPTVPDKLCAHMVHLVQQPSTKASVDAQAISNALWSLHRIRRSPVPAHLSSLLAHFSSLFRVQGRQPASQNMSNVVLAMAGLGHEQSSHVAIRCTQNCRCR